MVTIYDIAKRCGCSPSTVSKAINNYPSIPVSTRTRILDTMEQMNYILDTNAKILSTGSSKSVGILSYFALDISPFKQPLFIEILDSFQKEMNKNKYDLVFISRTVAGKNESFYKNCVSRHIDGVLLFGDTHEKEMQEVIKSDLPTVGFDYYENNMTSVTSNNYQATKDLTNYLLKSGHKNIVYIHGDLSKMTKLRIKGFKDAINESGLKFNEKMLVQSDYVVNDILHTLKEIVVREERPTAIMFPDDFTAIYGMKALNSLGIRCPEDISIVGFDGIDMGQIITPQLTTIKQNTETIGKLLALNLIKQIDNKKKTQELFEVPASLIIGKSTKQIN